MSKGKKAYNRSIGLTDQNIQGQAQVSKAQSDYGDYLIGLLKDTLAKRNVNLDELIPDYKKFLDTGATDIKDYLAKGTTDIKDYSEEGAEDINDYLAQGKGEITDYLKQGKTDITDYMKTKEDLLTDYLTKGKTDITDYMRTGGKDITDLSDEMIKYGTAKDQDVLGDIAAYRKAAAEPLTVEKAEGYSPEGKAALTAEAIEDVPARYTKALGKLKTDLASRGEVGGATPAGGTYFRLGEVLADKAETLRSKNLRQVVTDEEDLKQKQRRENRAFALDSAAAKLKGFGGVAASSSDYSLGAKKIGAGTYEGALTALGKKYGTNVGALTDIYGTGAKSYGDVYRTGTGALTDIYGTGAKSYGDIYRTGTGAKTDVYGTRVKSLGDILRTGTGAYEDIYSTGIKGRSSLIDAILKAYNPSDYTGEINTAYGGASTTLGRRGNEIGSRLTATPKPKSPWGSIIGAGLNAGLGALTGGWGGALAGALGGTSTYGNSSSYGSPISYSDYYTPSWNRNYDFTGLGTGLGWG